MDNNILVVDDEVEIADVLEMYLQNEDYTGFKFYNAKEAIKCMETTEIDLALLDICCPVSTVSLSNRFITALALYQYKIFHLTMNVTIPAEAGRNVSA